MDSDGISRSIFVISDHLNPSNSSIRVHTSNRVGDTNIVTIPNPLSRYRIESRYSISPSYLGDIESDDEDIEFSALSESLLTSLRNIESRLSVPSMDYLRFIDDYYDDVYYDISERSSYLLEDVEEPTVDINKYSLRFDEYLELYFKDKKDVNFMCDICFEKPKNEDLIIFHNPKHFTHKKCMEQYIEFGKTLCPTCRFDYKV